MTFERGQPSARDTQAQYARHARRYAESGLHRRGESLETVRSLAAATPADRALDIGTGTGFTGFALAGDGASGATTSQRTKRPPSRRTRAISRRARGRSWKWWLA